MYMPICHTLTILPFHTRYTRLDIARCRVEHSEDILGYVRKGDKQYAVQVEIWREVEKDKGR
ncbi:hypothetical protein EON63_25215 [archaeon]|nr:MAG: hypothetical protein EON63_25215 [archaeon]